MMIFFIGGIIIFSIITIVCIFLLIRLSSKESQFMEVSNRYLKDIGKNYNRDKFAMAIYELYRDIIDGVQKERYEFLKDVLSDNIYNNYLREIKISKDRQIKNIVTDIKPVFSRLISLINKDGTEIAKVWMKISFIEYMLDMSPQTGSQEKIGNENRVIGGSKTRRFEKEYIITLVKRHTPKESVACPACGYITDIILRNQCIRCGSNIVNRKFHWVIIAKEDKPLSR